MADKNEKRDSRPEKGGARPPEPDLPERLRADLTRLFGRSPRIPERVDSEILARSRRLQARRRRRKALLRWAGAVSAAASLLLVARIVFLSLERSRPPASARLEVAGAPPAASSERGANEPASPWDLDGSGKVTIVDALLLAKRLESHRASPQSAWDLNGDGTVDQADVDAVAMAAVRLKGG